MEVMVASGILLAIVSLVFSIIWTGRISTSVASARLSLYSQARQAATAISQELMLSNSARIFLLDNNKSIKFSIPDVDANGDLKKVGSDLEWGDGETAGNSIKYLIKDGKLVRQVLNSSGTPIQGKERVIAENASDFNIVLPLDSSQYQIGLTLLLSQGARYSESRLPDAITYTIPITVTPQN